jgi:hypothetical protein
LGRGYRIRPSVNSLGLEMLFFARVTIGCKETRGTEGEVGDAEDAAGRGVLAVLEEADDRVCTGVEGRN